MTTSNTTIEEGSCTIVIFFLLLPVMICIIKDVMRDFKSYINLRKKGNQSHFERNLNLEDESESLLRKSKDSDDDENVDDDIVIDNVDNINKHITSSPNLSVTLIDSERNVLAQTKTPNMTSTDLCANSKIPELILSPIMPAYEQCINVSIKPMELMLWLLFLTLSYIALRTMVVTKNMRYNFKYNAVEMQDIFELCLRGIIMYIFGNIAQRVCYKFFLWIGWFVFFYPFVFQICPTSFTIDTEVSMDWTLISICIFVGVSNVYIVLDNFYYVWKIKKWWIYGYSSFFIVVLYHIIFIKSANNNIDIHIHHHHWAFILSLFLHSKKDSSIVMHALLTSVFIHGITVFGCENLFDYKNLEDVESIEL